MPDILPKQISLAVVGHNNDPAEPAARAQCDAVTCHAEGRRVHPSVPERLHLLHQHWLH